MTSASGEKWRFFNCFFSRVGLRTCQHPCTFRFTPVEGTEEQVVWSTGLVWSLRRRGKILHLLRFETRTYQTVSQSLRWRSYSGCLHNLSPLRNLSFAMVNKGWDSSVGIATRYGLDGPGIESQWGARFSAPVQTGPGAHPASCTMGTGSFPGGKAAGEWRWTSTTSNAEVKERVELYLYSPSGTSWPVLRWSLSLPLWLINHAVGRTCSTHKGCENRKKFWLQRATCI